MLQQLKQQQQDNKQLNRQQTKTQHTTLLLAALSTATAVAAATAAEGRTADTGAHKHTHTTRQSCLPGSLCPPLLAFGCAAASAAANAFAIKRGVHHEKFISSHSRRTRDGSSAVRLRLRLSSRSHPYNLAISLVCLLFFLAYFF